MNSTKQKIFNLAQRLSIGEPAYYTEGLMIDLESLVDEYTAEVIRETLAAWMIKWGYATGHGDTTEDLLEELREQIEEVRDEKTS